MKRQTKLSHLPLKPDPEWIRDREKLLRQVKAEVSGRLGAEPADLREFRARYERELRRPWAVSSKSELMNAIESADLVYGGDFHASSQAQRTHLRILRALSDDRPVVLALECFARSSQKWLDAYLRGDLALDALKKRARWGKSWGFPWENYRPLLEIAKRRGFRLIGLNETTGSLTHASIPSREKKAAEKIREARRSSPSALVYVIFGDLHLAQGHLPRAVRQGLPRQGRLREVIVHLNPERIYFQLAARGLELTVDVVKLSESCFCIMSSPPWVQWQSYLLYLDRSLDDSALDRGDEEEDAEDDDDADVYDPTDQVAGLIRLVARDLKVAKDIKLNHLAVYSVDDNRVWQSLERKLKATERQIARQLLASGKSFYLPSSGAGYLARPTINHAATIAGQYVHAVLSGRKRSLWRMPSDFSRLIWVEATAYFMSKLINHQRRSRTLSDLKAELAMAATGDVTGIEAMKLAIDRLVSELIFVRQGRRRASRLRPRRKSSYLDAARILGGMLGDRLYMAHRSRKLGSKEIVQLLSRDVTHASFERDYEEILRRLQSVTVGSHAKSRPERL